MTAGRWLWVSLPWATFGLRLEWQGYDWRVVEAPPIARWALGQDGRAVAGWARRKPGGCAELLMIDDEQRC